MEGRGADHQEAGALRDMIQSHLLQLMATIAMELPAHLKLAAFATSERNCCATFT